MALVSCLHCGEGLNSNHPRVECKLCGLPVCMWCESDSDCGHCHNLCNSCDELAIMSCRSCNKVYCSEHLRSEDPWDRCRNCQKRDYAWNLEYLEHMRKLDNCLELGQVYLYNQQYERVKPKVATSAPHGIATRVSRRRARERRNAKTK